jgi:hypothetical protein
MPVIQPIILKQFLDKSEIDQLNSWTLTNYPGQFFQPANMGKAETQFTTRYWGKLGEDQNVLQYPDTAYSIKQRLIDHFRLEKIKYPPFKDGISNYIYFKDATIYPHRDGIWHSIHYTLHCNAITQLSTAGGVTKIKNDKWVEWATEPGDLLCYPVTEIDHYVTKCEGDIPRIMWSWAFCLNKKTYNPITNSYSED